ncbi:MAG: hypothetical protein DMF85_17795 [Acidobacteria bacterium]|nr:MAG: hypothetical protein DMF85_17795 [Acidobacteriota bacterium]
MQRVGTDPAGRRARDLDPDSQLRVRAVARDHLPEQRAVRHSLARGGAARDRVEIDVVEGGQLRHLDADLGPRSQPAEDRVHRPRLARGNEREPDAPVVPVAFVSTSTNFDIWIESDVCASVAPVFRRTIATIEIVPSWWTRRRRAVTPGRSVS